MRRVFIVNRSGHDYSEAEKYGELVFLSDGPMPRYSVNNMHREFSEVLKSSTPEDYILLCGLNVMNCIACSTFVSLHGRLNLLLYKDNVYVERNLIFCRDDCGDNEAANSVQD